MPYGITQCYLPSGSGDFPAFTPAEAGTQFSDPVGMQGWVDLVPANGRRCSGVVQQRQVLLVFGGRNKTARSLVKYELVSYAVYDQALHKFVLFVFTFNPNRNSIAKFGYRHRMSSVCVSVKRVYCDKTTEPRMTRFSLKSSVMSQLLAL